MEFSTLLLTIEEDIAILAINRPKEANTLTLEMVDELEKAFQYLEKKDDVRGVILTGSGEKIFMAGADVSMFRSMGPLEARAFTDFGHEHICNYIENFPKPVIAAVNGYALGGGCELIQLCDIRIASTRAVFAQPETSLGIMPLYTATKRLQRLVGFGRAKELIMTGRWIKADEALQIGLVTKVVEPEKLLDEAKATMKQIFKSAPTSIYFSKIAINRTADLDMAAAGEVESDLASILFGLEDKNEGVDAFLEKRSPDWQGR